MIGPASRLLITKHSFQDSAATSAPLKIEKESDNQKRWEDSFLYKRKSTTKCTKNCLRSQLIRQIYVTVRLILGFTKMLFSCLHNIWIFRETYLTNGRRPPPAVGRRCENCVQLERGGLPETSLSNLEKIKLKLWRFEISIKWFRARKTKMQNADASTEKYLKIALVVHQIHSFLWSALS